MHGLCCRPRRVAPLALSLALVQSSPLRLLEQPPGSDASSGQISWAHCCPGTAAAFRQGACRAGALLPPLRAGWVGSPDGAGWECSGVLGWDRHLSPSCGARRRELRSWRGSCLAPLVSARSLPRGLCGEEWEPPWPPRPHILAMRPWLCSPSPDPHLSGLRAAKSRVPGGAWLRAADLPGGELGSVAAILARPELAARRAEPGTRPLPGAASGQPVPSTQSLAAQRGRGALALPRGAPGPS